MTILIATGMLIMTVTLMMALLLRATMSTMLDSVIFMTATPLDEEGYLHAIATVKLKRKRLSDEVRALSDLFGPIPLSQTQSIGSASLPTVGSRTVCGPAV